jgi:hypothetical protein
MKTSVVMTRKMGDFSVNQRTSDGMFNATALVEQWNKVHNKKLVADFIRLDTTKVFVETVKTREGHNMGNPILSKKGKNGGTWMHPLVFIDFAMWLNPEFKYDVLKFVYDELIKQRIDAGDNYVQLSASGVKLSGYNFVEVAKAMQWIVYGKSGKNLRQTATQEQLKELNDLQTKLSFAVDMGYITSYPQLLEEMRKIWKEKKNKIPF